MENDVKTVLQRINAWDAWRALICARKVQLRL